MAKETETEKQDILEGHVPAVVRNAPNGIMIGGQVFETVKAVNLPTLKHDTGQSIAVRFDAQMRIVINKITEKLKVDGVEREVEREVSMHVVRVTELSTQQPFEYVCNAMTAANIEGAYPNNDYVGRSFAIQKLGVVAGKRYKEVRVVEIQPKQL